MISGFFKNLVYQSKRDASIYAQDAQMQWTIERIRKDVGEGLIACAIIHLSNEKILASYNFQESMKSIFVKSTFFIQHALNAAAFPRLRHNYKIYLTNSYLIMVHLIGNIQVTLVLDSTQCNIGVIEGVTIDEISGILKDIT